MRPLTPQQIADAAAKRAASVAQRKATGGLTVRQQRAAAKAAKLGQPVPPPPPPRPTPPPFAAPPPRATFSGRRRRRFNNGFGSRSTVVPPAAPVFATPKPEPRALKLAALATIEDAFKLTPKTVTQEMRDTFEKYQKLKNRALAVNASTRPEDRNEADNALRAAVLALVKLAF